MFMRERVQPLPFYECLPEVMHVCGLFGCRAKVWPVGGLIGQPFRSATRTAAPATVNDGGGWVSGRLDSRRSAVRCDIIMEGALRGDGETVTTLNDKICHLSFAYMRCSGFAVIW